jgi:hypothetical protein
LYVFQRGITVECVGRAKVVMRENGITVLYLATYISVDRGFNARHEKSSCCSFRSFVVSKIDRRVVLKSRQAREYSLPLFAGFALLNSAWRFAVECRGFPMGLTVVRFIVKRNGYR